MDVKEVSIFELRGNPLLLNVIRNLVESIQTSPDPFHVYKNDIDSISKERFVELVRELKYVIPDLDFNGLSVALDVDPYRMFDRIESFYPNTDPIKIQIENI